MRKHVLAAAALAAVAPLAMAQTLTNAAPESAPAATVYDAAVAKKAVATLAD